MEKYVLFVLLFTFFLTFYSCESSGDIYNAIVHMGPLVEIERRLIKVAKQYLDSEKLKLNGLRQFAKSVEEASKLSHEDPLKYVGNPINSYLIIKRFTSGWKELADRLSVDDSKITGKKLFWPCEKNQKSNRKAVLFNAEISSNFPETA